MYKFIYSIILFIWIYSCSSIKEGYYIGFDKIGQISNDCELIHKNHLLIKGDSAFLFKEPYFVENNDTIASASDGGFYYYRGTINRENDKSSLFLRLTLIKCEYCIRETRLDSITGNEIFEPEMITCNVQTGEKLIIDKIAYLCQKSERFPVDRKCFYEMNESEVEESPDIELYE